ncbi:hypothetical protein CONPUDRAFT_78788 [Coniophora puteana RWD-64-598 SS2]|uniref:SET domain-containing protein n=1 Tax=Coniophora puteana (strain RWD-64-598) TaxID=741705 RepID=A0A5M3N6E8_CONPW|nr:uncharacterized protein CONPUDRAFT_78788 [Coniophora puteana RWD-64-598 SS2]EIW86441.1 hypothetical protein CONPUDRAFT_78788 [Coniophora puteana RWD-64-598 SS2]
MINPPPHWQQHVQYLATPFYHTSVSTSIRSFLSGQSSSNLNHTPRHPATSPHARIKVITLPSHQAHGQRGLFAIKKIPPRTHIIDYVGEVHCDDRPDSDYDLSLYRFQDGTSVGIDASAMGNEARFVNDYRGIRAKPNATFVEGRTSSGELRMSVWSVEEVIKKGDEIVVSYGKAWWYSRNNGML